MATLLDPRINRRALIGAGAAAIAFGGLSRHARAQQTGGAVSETYLNQVDGYGPLMEDPLGVIDLPAGFEYRVVAHVGETMSDGLFVPGKADGMGCFSEGGSRIRLVCNHELDSGDIHIGPGGVGRRRLDRIDPSRAYDTDKSGAILPGGTTTILYDMDARRTVSHHLSLIGTSTNCCGGVTPWGSWLSCEETEETPEVDDVTKAHGWVFEVPARARGLVEPVPLTGLGRFDHEAVCIDPRTGVVYLTEDKLDGLFYRFIPDAPGELVRGGRLQAMAFRDALGADSSNRDMRIWSVGDWREVVWIDLQDVHSPDNALRQRGHLDGAARVARGEGVVWGDGELYLAATSGGPLQRGQILRYVPSPSEGRAEEARAPGRVQLFVESADERVMNMGDNLAVAPWGHLFVCEDNYSDQLRNHLKAITPDGRLYTIGRNIHRGNSEFAGACFSPDGSTLFINIQKPGITLALTGPWSAVRT